MLGGGSAGRSLSWYKFSRDCFFCSLHIASSQQRDVDFFFNGFLLPFKRHANTGREAQKYLVLSFLLHRFFLGNLIICSSFICIFILLFFYNISSSCCRSLRRRSIIARMQIPRNRAVQTLCTSFQVVIAFVLLAECICMHCKMYLYKFKQDS